MTRAEALQQLQDMRAMAPHAISPSVALGELDRLEALFLGFPEDSPFFNDPLLTGMLDVMRRALGSLVPAAEPTPAAPPPPPPPGPAYLN
jgi:hypothetical protein